MLIRVVDKEEQAAMEKRVQVVLMYSEFAHIASLSSVVSPMVRFEKDSMMETPSVLFIYLFLL